MKAVGHFELMFKVKYNFHTKALLLIFVGVSVT